MLKLYFINIFLQYYEQLRDEVTKLTNKYFQGAIISVFFSFTYEVKHIGMSLVRQFSPGFISNYDMQRSPLRSPEFFFCQLLTFQYASFKKTFEFKDIGPVLETDLNCKNESSQSTVGNEYFVYNKNCFVSQKNKTRLKCCSLWRSLTQQEYESKRISYGFPLCCIRF